MLTQAAATSNPTTRRPAALNTHPLGKCAAIKRGAACLQRRQYIKVYASATPATDAAAAKYGWSNEAWVFNSRSSSSKNNNDVHQTSEQQQSMLASSPHSASEPLTSSARSGSPPTTQPGSGSTQTGSSRQTSRARIMDLPVTQIRRPLAGVRANDPSKVEALMGSIQEVGLQEPIDVLEVEGQYYGFSGCHRYEAHQRLGLPTIRCRVRKANRDVLRMHLA